MVERAVASDTISLLRMEIGSQRLRLAGDHVRRAQRPVVNIAEWRIGRAVVLTVLTAQRKTSVSSHAESRVHTLVSEAGRMQ